MSLSGIAKFLLGLLLAIALLVGGGVAAALYFMNKVSIRPPKPIFANDQPTSKAQHRTADATAKSAPLPAARPSAMPSSTQTPSPKLLEPGAYKARIIWPHGLSLRSQPSLDSEHIGSLSYNQPVVVLEESADKTWQRVRLLSSQREGWIKAGNAQRVEKHQ